MHAYAGRQFVPFLWWSLVWPGREANSRSTVRKADTLPTEPTRHGDFFKESTCLYISCNAYVREVAVGERIAYWIRTPQVPGSRPGWYGTFYWASDCWPPWQHQVERSLVCVEGRGRIFRSGLTQDIKMGSCVFQCDVPHQWIAQRQVGPVSVYCDGVGCRVLCLRHGISVWQHIGQSTTATSRHRRDMTSDVSKRP